MYCFKINYLASIIILFNLILDISEILTCFFLIQFYDKYFEIMNKIKEKIVLNQNCIEHIH